MNKHIIAQGPGFAVHPTGDPGQDLANIQWAVDHAQAGATVTLRHYALLGKHGDVTEFDLGPDGMLYLNHDVRLEGEVLQREPGGRGVKKGTTILNGRQLQWGMLQAGGYAPVCAAIKDIRFKGFSGGAVRITACRNASEILGCSFVEYYKGQSVTGGVTGAFPIVVNNDTAPDLLGDSLSIRECFFGNVVVPPGEDPVAFAKGFNNVMHLSHCNLDLEFSDNEIADMYWVGLAVYGNKGHTTIARNLIRKQSWNQKEGAAIAFGLRPKLKELAWDGNATIEKNRVIVEAADSYGILVALLDGSQFTPPVPPAHVIVRDNVVEMKPSPGVTHDKAALACLGACEQSTWSGNVVTGSGRYGIRHSGALPDLMTQKGMVAGGIPAGNTFIGNHLAGGPLTDPIDGKTAPFDAFEATHAQVCVEQGTQIEVSDNSLGPVSGANAGAPAVPTPAGQRAGILWWGKEGRMSRNDFRSSGIDGWSDAPEHVGCIYLAEGSEDNVVEYVEKDFPPATLPPVEHQVFDAGVRNVIRELVPAIP